MSGDASAATVVSGAHPLTIGGLTAASPWVLAPMAGITDRQFRRVVRRVGGVGIVTMEFVSADGAARRDARTLRLLRFLEEERPISVQIYGADPETMAEAARIVEDVGADLCDINMGCPANKILKGCRGAALMGEPELSRRIVAAVRSAIRIPLTVKFRLGMRDDCCNFLEIGRICQEEGADAVAMHARTAKQMYRGRAEWERIAELVAALRIPVLGNGDVATATDAVRLLRSTGCAGVLIGRASMKNPWIYRQASELLAGRSPVEPSLDDRRALIMEHVRLVLEEEDRRTALHKIRTFTAWYSRGFPEGRDLRVRIPSLATVEAFVEAIDAFFKERSEAA